MSNVDGKSIGGQIMRKTSFEQRITGHGNKL